MSFNQRKNHVANEIVLHHLLIPVVHPHGREFMPVSSDRQDGAPGAGSQRWAMHGVPRLTGHVLPPDSVGVASSLQK